MSDDEDLDRERCFHESRAQIAESEVSAARDALTNLGVADFDAAGARLSLAGRIKALGARFVARDDAAKIKECLVMGAHEGVFGNRFEAELDALITVIDRVSL